jgi:hypothetical protein
VCPIGFEKQRLDKNTAKLRLTLVRLGLNTQVSLFNDICWFMNVNVPIPPPGNSHLSVDVSLMPETQRIRGLQVCLLDLILIKGDSLQGGEHTAPPPCKLSPNQ